MICGLAVFLGQLIFLEQAAKGSLLGASESFRLLLCAPLGNDAHNQGAMVFKVDVVLDEADKRVVTKAFKFLDREVQSEQGALDREGGISI